MDKIISARVDEAVAERIGILAHKLHLSRKKVIENAVGLYARQMDGEGPANSLREPFGAWSRRESAAVTVDKVRRGFRKSMERRRR